MRLLGNYHEFMQPVQVEEFVKHHFGIDGSAIRLVGERDLNFRVNSPIGDFIFKVHQSTERDLIVLQNELLLTCSTIDSLLEPIPIKSVDGAFVIDIDSERIGRLLTWIDGDLMSAGHSLSPELLSSLGHAVAVLDAHLEQESTDERFTLVSRPFGWNVIQTEQLMSSISLVSDEHVRDQVARIISDATNFILPSLAGLNTQLIHNDANDNNIVVRDGRVVSLIDFGDVIAAPRICGLAVAATYALDDSADPIRGILDVVRGYHTTHALTSDELSLLFPLIKLRIATSILMAAIQSAGQPHNDYLNISQEKFRALLNTLVTTDPDLTLFRFRAVCGYEANPQSREVRQWLLSGNAPIADVVMPPFRDAKKLWLDWSAANENIARSTEQIVALMDDEGADVAIGHYCENRSVYQGEAFDIRSDNSRTVHLGVDLFAPAGTPVYAGHDGTVEYFNDNNVYLDYGPVIILRHATNTGVPFWPLYGHLSRPSLEGLHIGKIVKAGDQIATMGEEHENVGWPPHTHFQLLTSLCGMGLDVYGVAPLNELPVWRSISPNPNLILKIAEGTDAHAHLRQHTLENERSVAMSRALSLNFNAPLEIVSGKGAYLYDNSGRSYLDLVNNVAHVGHSHPRVVRAGQDQMAILNTNTRYINQNAIEYARALASTFPDPLSVVFFVNSGSEANDLALRLAQAHTRAKGMLVLDHAYHGHLSSIIDISPYKFARKGGAGRPDHVRVVPLPDSYKGVHRGPDAGARYADEFRSVLGDLDQPLCAFINESIVSTAGQVTLAEGFLPEAYRMTRAAGGVCIADEVQIGMGRVGTHFWGFELHGVVPDIVTIGKPIGNGHPLAAVVTTPEIADSFLNGMEYFNTFGGNPVSAAIGQAVLDVVQDQDLQANAQRIGTYLMDSVRELAKTHEYIGDVRGSGLFIGVEFVKSRSSQEPATQFTSDLMEFARERGVFLSCDGPANNVLKIKPPMVINHTDVNLLLSVLDDGLKALR